MGRTGRWPVIRCRQAAGSSATTTWYDDPNDIYPHEHRRELRAARVFAAWVNHDVSRANNTLDMIEGDGEQAALRHSRSTSAR